MLEIIVFGIFECCANIYYNNIDFYTAYVVPISYIYLKPRTFYSTVLPYNIYIYIYARHKI